MAEEDSELELDRFNKDLESLLNSSASEQPGFQSKIYCSRFCELVEENTSRWQVPLPQLQVLRSALCAFVRGAASFPSDCEHVRYTLSSLALSVFELLLFFGKDEFPEDPLKDILDSFQECYSSLVRHQNVYLLQVRQIIKDGGPWTSSVLQGILKEHQQPQEEVDRYLSSELPMFFELRVRYLLACERNREAMALTQRCSQHPTAGRHLFFKQAYLSCLWKASQHERLSSEMAEIDGKDAVEILCIAENEEKDELLLELSKAFLLQQLRSGDMYYLWNLVFIWCKLYLRVKASKQDFLEECNLMILSATNIKAIFPFIKVILEELGRNGLSFCVELCATALQTDLKNDPLTKSLIYKTIAYMLPSDLEICRACALLVFFLERTVEAYKTVFLLYTHPDQEYHLDTSPIGNSVRFEVIQILKKGLFFDPEFWNLLNIKTNCLKLMSDQVAKTALFEIMEEDKWVPNYCSRGQCRCHAEPERTVFKPVAKPTHTDKQGSETSPASNASSAALLPKKRGRKPGSHIGKDLDPFPLRRSFRQLDSAQNHTRQLSSRRQRFLTRHAEMTTLKRRGRKPRWLLEELAAQAENGASRQEVKKPGRPPKQIVSENIAVDTPVIEITMEYSYPDNEVDLPVDVQSRSAVSFVLEESESPCQETPTKLCLETPNSHCEVPLEESIHSWRDKAKATEEYVFWAQESIGFVKYFHTYSKLPEEEGTSVGDDEVITASDVAEQERPLEISAPIENHEAVQLNSVDEAKERSLTPAATPEVPTTLEDAVDENELPVLERQCDLESVLPVLGIEVRDEDTSSIEDTIPTLERAVEIVTDTISSSPHDALNNTIDDSCPSVLEKAMTGLDKETDNVPTLENTHEITANTTPSNKNTPQSTADTLSTPEKILKGLENASVAPREGTAPISEKKAQESQLCQTSEDEHQTTPPKSSSSASVPTLDPGVRLSRRCRLCNKEYRKSNSSIMRHAFLHYRLERKCMFCQNFISIRGPLCHFKEHIRKLKDLRGLADEKKKLEGSPEQSVKADQTVQGTLPKKPRPGLAQIKSKLLMRLNFRRETIAHKAEDNTDTDKKTLKQSFTKKSGSMKERNEEKKEENDENEEKSTANRKIIYLTRGLVRKSESKARFLRKRTPRGVRTRTSMTLRDVSVTKDGPPHKLNGVIWKKRKLRHAQDKSNHVTDKNVHAATKQENKELKTKKMRSDKKMEGDQAKHNSNNKQDKVVGTNTERRSLRSSETKTKPLPESGLKKKRGRWAKQTEDTTKVSKREEGLGTSEQKQNKNDDSKPAEEPLTAEPSETVLNSTENGTVAESKEPSQPMQKNKKQPRAATAFVECPGESCTFRAKPGPVLSHVLIHHPGDTKALEFFYNFGKQKCLFCGRRIWTAQHFFDHVISHRGNLKHPCYDVDCKERFKTRWELCDHMVKDHSTLKAGCCFPGCTVQVSNPMRLYSHERGHYRGLRQKPQPKKDKSATSKVLPDGKKGVDQSNPLPAPNSKPAPTEIQIQSIKGTGPESATAAKTEDEIPLVLNKSSVSYSTKSPKLVNGHIDHENDAPVKPLRASEKDQDTDYGKPSTKPFVRPPPSAYLDELYISMPKRWKGPQVTSKAIEVSPIKRQVCSRCAASFSTDEELQGHRGKCTSLFGFDSDDESAS